MKEKRYEIEGVFEYYMQDHPRLGSGFRTVVAHSRGPKFIQVLDITRLVNIRVTIADWDSAKRTRRVDMPLITLGRHLAVRLSIVRKFKLQHAPAVARGILKEISNV